MGNLLQAWGGERAYLDENAGTRVARLEATHLTLMVFSSVSQGLFMMIYQWKDSTEQNTKIGEYREFQKRCEQHPYDPVYTTA